MSTLVKEFLQLWSFPPCSVPASPKLVETEKNIRKILGDIAPQKPESQDIEQVFRKLKTAWQKDGTLRKLNTRDLKRAPWALFYREDNTRLVEETHLLKDYLGWLKEKGNVTACAALLNAFLQHYPLQSSAFQVLRAALKGLLDNPASLRLKSLANLCSHFGLLQMDGPKTFSKALLESPLPPQDLLVEAKLTGLLAQQGFIEHAYQNLLQLSRDKLGSGILSQAQLSRLFVFSKSPAGGFRFPALKHQLANTLLEPFEKGGETSDVRDAILAFTLDNFRDPRINPGLWHDVSTKARDVVFRWLVSATLEDFFRLLEHVAQDDPMAEKHWHFRKAFWSAYLKGSHISKAWVALGVDARSFAHKFLDPDRDQYGMLKKGMGANSMHSVLLMQIGDLTVAEWSHNGRCHIWKTAELGSPNFYKKSYSRPDLIMTLSSSQGPEYPPFRHSSSENGLWQNRVNRYIERQTGIRLMTVDYMPRDW